MEEMAYLKVDPGKDSAIESSLTKVPPDFKSVLTTLSELQIEFEKSHLDARKASLFLKG